MGNIEIDWKSEIFMGRSCESNSVAAIKVQNQDFNSSVVKWECEVLRALIDVPVVPRLIESGQANGCDFLIMELMSGEDMSGLRNRIRNNSVCGLIPTAVASFLSQRMLEGVKLIHRKGFIHRDIKPANFVRRTHDGTEFCVIDFGIAKQFKDENGNLRPMKDKAEFRGTTIYASPFVHQLHDQCPRDDLYSIIYVFIDLIVGKLPWTEAARAKDKPRVGQLKNDYLQDTESFINWIDEVINLIEIEHNIIDERYKNFNKVTQSTVRNILNHLKSLKYEDEPDYAMIHQELANCMGDHHVEDPNYEFNGFTWKGGIDKLAYIAQKPISVNYKNKNNVNSNGSSNNNNSSNNGVSNSNIANGQQQVNDVNLVSTGIKSIANVASMNNLLPTAGTIAIDNSKYNNVLQHKLTNYTTRMSNIRSDVNKDKISVSQNIYDYTIDNNSSNTANTDQHNQQNQGVDVKLNGDDSSGSKTLKPSSKSLEFSIAIRWKNLVKDMLSTLSSIINSSGGNSNSNNNTNNSNNDNSNNSSSYNAVKELFQLSHQVLHDSHHFYLCNNIDDTEEKDNNDTIDSSKSNGNSIGNKEAEQQLQSWGQFVELQSVIAQFYDAYHKLKHSTGDSNINKCNLMSIILNKKKRKLHEELTLDDKSVAHNADVIKVVASSDECNSNSNYQLDVSQLINPNDISIVSGDNDNEMQ